MPEPEDPTEPEVDPTDPETDPAEPEADPAEPGEDELQDAGKRALDSMKAKWKAERDRRKALEAQLAGQQPDPSDDADAIRAQAERTATAKANARVLRSEIKAAAAGRLQNPDDALRFIDLGQFEADEQGDFDQDEIRDAIDDLLEKSPYLAAQGQRRHGDGGAGPRGRAKPKQYTRADLDRMSPAQILAARDAGELDHLLGKS